MMPSYYAFPGLKMAYLTDKQREAIKNHYEKLYKAEDISQKIKSLVCDYYHVTQAQLEGSRGKGVVPWARQVFCFLVKKYTRFTLADIGRTLSNRDHTTIIHSIKTVKDNIETYKEFEDQISYLEQELSDRLYKNFFTVKELK